jgi:hypothetical protein
MHILCLQSWAGKNAFSGDVVQLVRTPACHAGGREFEPRRPRQFIIRAASFAALYFFPRL